MGGCIGGVRALSSPFMGVRESVRGFGKEEKKVKKVQGPYRGQGVCVFAGVWRGN